MSYKKMLYQLWGARTGELSKLSTIPCVSKKTIPDIRNGLFRHAAFDHSEYSLRSKAVSIISHQMNRVKKMRTKSLVGSQGESLS